MSLHFAEYFVAFAGDTTHDISRQSLNMKRHRSHRQRQQRKDVIGFSQSLLEWHDSSDDDFEPDEEALSPPEPSFSMGASSVSSTDEEFSGHLEKMSNELDGLVRFIRRGAESLAGGSSEAAPAFGILAFALEDWDL
jgi:gamma-tubulin complex component 5